MGERILPYFSIDGEVGGNQEWFTNLVMKMGGCAAATACDSSIYFALYRNRPGLYPFDRHALTRQDYIRFGMQMKPYIRPRIGGVRTLAAYAEGFENYLKDRGEEGIAMEAFSGEESLEKADRAIREQIDRGLVVPYLLLNHRDRKKFEDFIWHWFLLYGYREGPQGLEVWTATYGEGTLLSLEQLWDTGEEEKGGLILYRLSPEGAEPNP